MNKLFSFFVLAMFASSAVFAETNKPSDTTDSKKTEAVDKKIESASADTTASHPTVSHSTTGQPSQAHPAHPVN